LLLQGIFKLFIRFATEVLRCVLTAISEPPFAPLGAKNRFLYGERMPCGKQLASLRHFYSRYEIVYLIEIGLSNKFLWDSAILDAGFSILASGNW
jgi:hypothetical protein